MKENNLITKWLDHDLTEKELEEFKKMDSYSSFVKISETAKKIEVPDYEQEQEFNALKEVLSKSNKNTLNPIIKYVSAIAAILIVAIGLFFVMNNNSLVNQYAAAKTQTSFNLPDASVVTLNAGSQINYDANNWDNKRALTLEGEAYFKVAKGEKFSVETSQGTITVLGTQFTVKDRENYFEVVCYEGLVSVLYNGKTYKLSAGKTLTVINNILSQQVTSQLAPSWINNITIFKSVPLRQVFNELERQYDIKIIAEGVEPAIVFTGSFSHKNMDKALQSVTIPANLDYKIENNKVLISKK